ncbi:ATP-grasp domain-containing protein [Streptomyces olivaceiscleroticus]|uniref:ATP-grasp domain-containing protein n=1 Tax=Streptomyces olivaceiscleroticus TaxID=68245 RepID=A0ABP3KDS3_9ACTN
MSDHILFFGGGQHLPGLIRARSEASGRPCRVSVLGRIEGLSKLGDPNDYDRIVLLRADDQLEEWLAAAMAIHEADPVTHIGAISEQSQEIAAEAGRKLGVHTYDAETVRVVNDKYAMRKRLAEAGVEAVPYAAVSGPADVLAFCESFGLPCIVKPRQSTASRGVGVVRSVDDAEAAFARAAAADETSGIVAEAYIPGAQYSVEAFSEGGEHVVLAITRKYSDPVSMVELGHVLPAPLDAASQEAIESHVRMVLDALGVEFGPTHTEIVLAEHQPRVIETHLRLGGDDIWQMITGATGVDVVDLLMRQCLGDQVLADLRAELAHPARTPRSEAIWFAGAPENGVLVDVLGVDGPHPPGVTVEASAASGRELHGLENSSSRLAKARAHAEDPAQALALAKEAIGGLRIVSRYPPEHLDLV